MIKMKDSRGGMSHTLGFATLSWLAATGVFIWAAFKGQYFLAEYGVFVGTNLAPYIFREKFDKDKSNV